MIVDARIASASRFVIVRPNDNDIGSWIFAYYLLSFVVGLAIGTVFHELGHAIGCRLSGLRVRRIVLGAGAPIVSCTWRGVPVEFHGPVPFSGAVHFDIPPGTRWPAVFTTIVGGPIGTAVCFASIASLTSVLSRNTMDLIGPGLVVSQVMTLAAVLWPQEHSDGRMSDGLFMWRIVKAMCGRDVAWPQATSNQPNSPAA